MNPLSSLAPAIKEMASAQKSSFATTQAVWRFLNNEKVSFKQLNEPIQQLAFEQIDQSSHPYALIIHDWSQLQYVKHNNKTQRLQRTHQYDSGYELQSSLVLSDKNGLPIAPIAQNLITAKAQLSTYGNTRKDTHLNELGCRMDPPVSEPSAWWKS